MIDDAELVRIAQKYKALSRCSPCYGWTCRTTSDRWALSSLPKIVIIDESPIRAAILEEGLREAGYTEVVQVNEMQSLLADAL